MAYQSNRSIRATALRFGLTPALLLTLLLGVAFTYLQFKDREALYLSHGSAIAEQTAHALGSLEPQAWEDLLGRMLEQPEVLGAHLFRLPRVGDRTARVMGAELVANAGPRLQVDHVLLANAPTRGSTPIVRAPFSAAGTDYVLALQLHPSPFGVRAYQVLMLGILAFLLCGIVASVWAVRLADRLNRVFAQFGNAMTSAASGNLNVRMRDFETREIGDLAAQFNHMVAALEFQRREILESHEQSLDDLRETLDTMEEQNIELDLARKKAQEANRGKSAFLANTSHEFRTPLNGIIGFTNLLLKTETNELQQEYLRTILRSSENLLSTINDLMDFSRIEAGTLVLDHVPVDVARTAEEALQILAPAAYDHNLEMVSIADDQLPSTLLGDPARLKQILINLVGNAIQLSRNGDVVLRISSQVTGESQNTVRISVNFPGNACSPEQRAEIHALLRERNMPSQSQVSANTLGLAISGSLIKQMDGVMGLDENRDSGTTLWFDVPMAVDRNFSSALPAENLSGSRWLLIDPNSKTRSQLARQLRRWQASVVELESTRDYLNAIQQMWQQSELPDAVLLDVKASDEEPQTLEEQVARLVNDYRCRVVIQGLPAELRNCYDSLRHLVAGFISKPLTSDSLLRIAKRVSPATTTNEKRSAPAVATRQPEVLAVDDNDANRRLIAALLENLKVKVTLAKSGEEALEKFALQSFDLVFMDIQMPGMDGIEATQTIRRQQQGKQRTPIIAITAHAGTEEKARLLAVGFDDFLGKPITEAQLGHAVQRWMQLAITAAAEQKSLPETSPVDIENCVTLSNGNVELARDMLRMLLDSLPDERQQLLDMLGTESPQPLHELIHRLYGGCCYCGVPPLRTAAEKLNRTAKARVEEGWHGLINDDPILSGQINAVVREIGKLLDWAEEKDIDALFLVEQGLLKQGFSS